MDEPKRRRPVSDQTTKPPEESITDDSLFLIEEANKEYSRAERELITFVERQVQLMRDNLTWGGREPSFSELQKTLSEYESVAVGLTSLYCTARIDRDMSQERYDDFYAIKFVETRNLYATLAEKKQPSTREIDMIVRKENLKELARLKADCISSETKRSVAERLVRNWEQFQWCLSNITKISVAEANASGVSKDKEGFDGRD